VRSVSGILGFGWKRQEIFSNHADRSDRASVWTQREAMLDIRSRIHLVAKNLDALGSNLARGAISWVLSFNAHYDGRRVLELCHDGHELKEISFTSIKETIGIQQCTSSPIVAFLVANS
jgi:hypothetical protein